MPLRIFHENGGCVKAHWLVVEDGAGEGGEILHFEIGRCIGDEREAGSVGLGEAIEGEGADVLDNFS